MSKQREAQIGLNMKNKLENIVENSRMIEAIADHLLDDHIELMMENESLKAVLNDFLEDAGYVPNSGWTLEKCKSEHKAGNGLALLIEKAHNLLGYAEPLTDEQIDANERAHGIGET